VTTPTRIVKMNRGMNERERLVECSKVDGN